jgi:hypothetical protein
MKGSETAPSAGLRQHGSPAVIAVRPDPENRTMAAHYGTTATTTQSHPVSAPAVMPSRLAIVGVWVPRLRQKPTSNRRGKGVGEKSSDRRASGSGPVPARRRAFVFAPEGWVQ